MRSYKSKVFKSKILAVSIAFVLLSISTILWYFIRERAFQQMVQNTSASAEYYANEIENKINSIDMILNEISRDITSDFEKPNTDWDELANFYIDNSEAIESVILVDEDLMIKRIASLSSNKYITEHSISDIFTDSKHAFALSPIYDINELKGFIYGEINIPELVLSVTSGGQGNYDFQLYRDGVPIHTNGNWKSSNKNLSYIVQIDLNSPEIFKLEIKPSDESVYLNTRYAAQILIFSCFLSVGIAMIIWIAFRLNYKSNLLLQAQEKLKANQAELEDKNSSLQFQLRNQQKLESIGILASGVAHEINSPINGVLNYSQLIIDSSDINSENTLYAKEIIKETERISKLVSNLLQFSRQQKENFSYARIEDIIERSVTLAQTLLRKDQIDIILNISEFLPDLKCRSQQIQQVLINLLTNARDTLNEKFIDYNENKVIIITADMLPSDDRKWVRITVEDHGKGIPLSVQTKIFQQFFTTKSIDKGTGLGLAISWDIAKEHNGNLSFETKEGEYTKFYLDLPVS